MNPEEILKGILEGDMRSLAKGITLIEGTTPDQKKKAQFLLANCIKINKPSTRIGISGSPGVGKSTLIEILGCKLIDSGFRVAVLAIDPSSQITGGSILGDRTRMERLSTEKNAFIRPSPSKTALGGVSPRTRETLQLCEAAGFDYTIVETVGVGQSETLVASMTDIFLMLQQPGAGDELQGIKKGILELADIIAITKWDGDSKQKAEIAQSQHVNALQLVKSHEKWQVPVLLCSSTEKKGIQQIIDKVNLFISTNKKNNEFISKRRSQNSKWFKEELNHQIMDKILSISGSEKSIKTALDQVIKQEIPARTAVNEIIDDIFNIQLK
ncbi:MAG: methylmalonyl Co-A mutase-associated GTPase MeaB [Zetaproteobacteria bacterium]|nr:methylmalonyl Co-A mutase-associated GTPase MeaB [Pseudobdellovibrionaceae bacterium]